MILCVGENLEQREAGKHFDVVTEQIKNVLYNFTAEDMAKIIVLTSRFGPSVQARPLPPSRLRRSTPASARCLPRSSVRP